MEIFKEDLSPTKYRSILNKMEEMINEGAILLIKSESLAYLELELFATLERHIHFGSHATHEELSSLVSILGKLKKCGEALFDEIDLLFS